GVLEIGAEALEARKLAIRLVGIVDPDGQHPSLALGGDEVRADVVAPALVVPAVRGCRERPGRHVAKLALPARLVMVGHLTLLRWWWWTGSAASSCSGRCSDSR